MAPSLLNLITDTERPTVRIDGVPYSLRLSSDLTLADYRMLDRLSPWALALCAREVITDDEGRELSVLLQQLCTIALDAPSAVHERLGDVNRAMVFKVFTERLSPRLMAAMSATEASRPTGATSSRGFNGSTGASRGRGGTRSRSGSSART